MGDDPWVIPDPPGLNFALFFGSTRSADPLPAECLPSGTSLQSEGAPLDVSHKADVAPLLIWGGGAE